MIRLGVQVSIAGGIYKSVVRARALRCTTMQIFSHNPRGWALKELDDDEVYLFKNLREEAGIRPLYVHTSYLINLCTSNEELYRKSKETFLNEIERAGFLGADYLITHLGSTGDSGKKQGMRRVVEALKEVSEQYMEISRNNPVRNLNLLNRINPALSNRKKFFIDSPCKRPKVLQGLSPPQGVGLSNGVKVLLENTAGERGEIGYAFEQLAEILDKVRDEKTEGGIVGGVCFDTCHAFASGYDLSTTQGIEGVIKSLDEIIGMEALKVIHLNDSKRPLGSRIDRHEDIGKGWIGLKGFRTILNQPTLRDIPFILETPKKGEEDDIRNLKVVRKLSSLRIKG